jgi:hypothetical protein
MAKPKNSLVNAMSGVGRESPPAPSPSPPSTPSPGLRPTTARSRPPSREGRKIIAGYFDPAVSKQLHQIALDDDTTLQELLREAINDLFTKRHKSPIA